MFQHYRYVVAGMGFVLYCHGFSLLMYFKKYRRSKTLLNSNLFQIRLNLYLAMIAMKNESTFNWDDNDQATMMASYFYGYTSLMIFSGSIIVKVGAKPLSCGGTVLAGMASLVYPWIVKSSFMGACLLRFVTGLAHASLMPALQSMLIPWAPHHESARFFFVQGSGCLIGSVASFYGGGAFIKQFGWENLFRLGGVLSILSGVLYWVLVESTPEQSKFVSTDELHFIQERRLQFKSSRAKKIPYGKMLTSAPVWAVNIAFATFATLHTFFANIMPKYLNDNLNVELSHAGKLTAIPTGVEFFTALFVTFCADAALTRGVSVKTVRRVIMTFAQLVPGVLCLVITQLTSLTWIMVVAALTLSICGVQPSGAFLNINELCPPYAAAGFAVANTLGNVAGTMLMQSMGLILERLGNTNATWTIVFVVIGVFNLIGACISWAFTEGEAQEWSKEKDEKEDGENKQCLTSRDEG